MDHHGDISRRNRIYRSADHLILRVRFYVDSPDEMQIRTDDETKRMNYSNKR